MTNGGSSNTGRIQLPTTCKKGVCPCQCLQGDMNHSNTAQNLTRYNNRGTPRAAAELCLTVYGMGNMCAYAEGDQNMHMHELDNNCVSQSKAVYITLTSCACLWHHAPDGALTEDYVHKAMPM